MKRPTPIREVLDALEWARVERMRTGSPDFVRAKVIEEQVQRLCEQLAKIKRQNPTQRNGGHRGKI